MKFRAVPGNQPLVGAIVNRILNINLVTRQTIIAINSPLKNSKSLLRTSVSRCTTAATGGGRHFFNGPLRLIHDLTHPTVASDINAERDRHPTKRSRVGRPR